MRVLATVALTWAPQVVISSSLGSESASGVVLDFDTCPDVHVGIVYGVGNNIHVGEASSPDDCCRKCSGELACVAWTYHSAGSFAGECIQHGSVQPTRADATAVSGAFDRPSYKYVGCFKDYVPAPGVPPVRALNHFNGSGSPQQYGVAACFDACVGMGYLYGGVTTSALSVSGGGGYGQQQLGRSSTTAKNANENETDWCYCDCNLNQAATPVVKAQCGNGSGVPGQPGALAVFTNSSAST